MNGVQLRLALRKCLPRLGIVLLSNHANPQFLAAVLRTEAGGWSYLLKRSVRDLDALKRVILGSSMGYVVLDQQIVDTLQHREASVLSRLTPPSIRDLVAYRTRLHLRSHRRSAGPLREVRAKSHQQPLPAAGTRSGRRLGAARVTAVLTYLQRRRVMSFGRTL